MNGKEVDILRKGLSGDNSINNSVLDMEPYNIFIRLGYENAS